MTTNLVAMLTPEPIDLQPNALGQAGTHVSPAAQGTAGVPVDFNPHSIDHMTVRIDPMPGRQTTVTTVGALRNAALAQTRQTPTPVVGYKQAQAQQVHPQPTYQPPPQAVVEAGVPLQFVPPSAAPAPPPPVPSVPIMSAPVPAFDAQPQFQPQRAPALTPFQALQRSRPQAAEVAPAREGNPPKYEVLFEFAGVGTFNGAYHDIIINNNHLVLIFDLGWKAGKFFPSTDASIALQISGVPEVFLVHTTDIQFVYNNFEFCVLLIEQRVQAS